jgi:hypothetical protein
MTCPSCGASFTVESLSDSKPRILRPEKEKAPVGAVVAEIPDIDDDEDEAVVIETDDDLEDDLLEDDDDNVSLEEIADVGADDDDE